MSGKDQIPAGDAALEAEVLGMWRCALKNDQLTVDDDLFACGGDSLLATRLLLEVERFLGKSLPPSILFETGTVRRLLATATAPGRVSPRVSVMIGPVNGKPVHFFHGDFEYGGVSAKTFSGQLGNGYRVHAIAPHLPHEGVLPDSIEGMAKERVHTVLEKQPEGPYVLIGHCNGALVAFEVARQLVGVRKQVKAVVMVDPVIVSVRRSAQVLFAVAGFIMNTAGTDKDRRRACLISIWRRLLRLERKTKDFWRRALLAFRKTRARKQPARDNAPALHASPQHGEEVNRHYLNAFVDYRPLPLDVPVLYVSLKYNGYAWRRIARNTTFVNIVRGRHSPWREDYSEYLVDRIREFINC